MSKEDLIAILIRKNCGVTVEELLNHRYQELLNQGLRVLTICNDGSGRSRTVADSLTARENIPAVRIIGGLRRITTDSELSYFRGRIQEVINSCPTVAVILTQPERMHYLSFFTNLRAHKYLDSTAAIRSLLAMEKE